MLHFQASSKFVTKHWSSCTLEPILSILIGGFCMPGTFPEKQRIQVKGPVVELDGDEMARIMWKHIKEHLIYPYLKLDPIYFDLQLPNRIRTSDQITLQAARAIAGHHVAIKCPTVTIDKVRSIENDLRRVFPSPNAAIRNILGGTVFHEPIICKNIPSLIPRWTKPIIVARHAYGDQYNSVDIVIPKPGRVELVYTPDDGSGQRKIQVCHIKQMQYSSRYSKGIALAMYNTDDSIISFAHCCFEYALSKNLSLYFSTKNTVLSRYDGRFIDIFEKIYDLKYRKKFMANGIKYKHVLIDNMVALAMKSNGGFVWACKNYDGDVQSDIVAQGYGSIGLMSTILQCHNSQTIMTEPAHGTLSRHYRLHLKGEPIYANPIASIYAWTRGLDRRAELDNNADLKRFTQLLEKACVVCVENGLMTKDLAVCIHGTIKVNRTMYLTTLEFLKAVKAELAKNFLCD